MGIPALDLRLPEEPEAEPIFRRTLSFPLNAKIRP